MTERSSGSCCDNPQPRILERSGRLFCGSCKRYLDRREEPAQEPLPETPPVTEIEEDEEGLIDATT